MDLSFGLSPVQQWLVLLAIAVVVPLLVSFIACANYNWQNDRANWKARLELLKSPNRNVSRDNYKYKRCGS